MFWNKRKKEKEMLEMIRMIRPTSQMALRQQCLLIAKGDVDEAKKLCDYYTDGMDELPMFDQPEPTWMDNTKQTLDSIFGWLSDHKDGLAQTYELIRNMSGGRLPSMGGAIDEIAEDEEALPPINE